jgi:hypothetical protein
MAMYDPEPVAPEAAPIAPEPAPVLRTRAVPPQRRSMASALILGLAAVVAVGGLAFAAGRLTAPPAAASTGFGRTGTNGQGFAGNFPRASGAAGGLGGAFRGGGGAGFGITGTVTAVSADSLTVQLTNGSTISIPLTSSTTYHQQTAGSASDVQVGKQVQVQLERNTTGGGAPASPGAGGGLGNLGSASSVTVLGQ